MNDSDRLPVDLEARLRRLCSRLDATAGFEARLAVQVAASGPPLAVAERARLRSSLELERLAIRARLQRRLYLGLVAAAAVGAGVALLVGPLLGRVFTAFAAFAALPSVAGLAAHDPDGRVALAIVIVVAAWLWRIVRASARDSGSWQALVRG
jgi:hypothetical protein